MSNVLVPAFGAELEWRGVGTAALSPASPHGIANRQDLDEVLSIACDANDAFLARSRPSERIGEAFVSAGVPWRPIHWDAVVPGSQAVPFAVTGGSLALCAELGLALRVPDIDTVRAVNSKVWSARARERIGVPLGAVARSAAEMRARASGLLDHGPIIVKEAFGVSGSGNLVVTSPARLRSLERWLASQEDAGADVELVIEPLLPKAADFSSHVLLAEDGHWAFLGFQGLLNHGSRYLGSRTSTVGELAALHDGGVRDLVDAMAAELARCGYHGPACIDGMILADGSVAAIIEVNARMSMGLLNLTLSRRLKPRGMASTLLKLRISGPRTDRSALDIIAHAGLAPRSPALPCILPITSTAVEVGGGPKEIVSVLLHRDASERAQLFQAMLAAFSHAGVETNAPQGAALA